MVAIGASAAAFGAFAEASASFEANETLMAGGVFTPAAPWSWGSEATTSIAPKSYADGDEAYAYGSGDLARRSGKFTDQDSQNQYLPLETGKDTLNLAATAADFYLDQLVKFTGFEEDQTEFGDAKIAVWMKSVDHDAEAEVGEPTIDDGEGGTIANPDYKPAVEEWTEHSLWVAVGDGVGGTVNVQLAGEYEPDKWYRLTIRSLGDVIGDKSTFSDKVAGFLIYIDGKLVAIKDGFVDYASNYEAAFTKDAAAAYKEGKLFVSRKADTADLGSIGYQGIGAIDDVIVDAEGPAFAQGGVGPVDVAFDFELDEEADENVYIDTPEDGFRTTDGDLIPYDEDAGAYLAPVGTQVLVPVAIDTESAPNLVFVNGEQTTLTLTIEITEAGVITIPASEVEVKTAGGGEDWPDPEDPTIAGKTASDVFGDAIPTEIADAPASKVAAWAKGKVDFAKKDTIIADAYLLDCAANDALEAAEKAKNFKIASITYDAESGEWIVKVVSADGEGEVAEGGEYFNGYVDIQPVTIDGAAEDAEFFKAVLVPAAPKAE